LNILLVEDVVDSGRTLAHVLEMLKTRLTKSLTVCLLLYKKYHREVPVPWITLVSMFRTNMYLGSGETLTNILATCVLSPRLT
jgi:hypoxanthine-guanine phosphoribosyltransferase